MKLKPSTLSVIVASVAGLAAIERPGEMDKSKPGDPQGGIFGDNQKTPRGERGEGRDATPRPQGQEQVAYLGVSGDGVSEALKAHLDLKQGLILTTVDPTSPAGLSGLKTHDIILTVGGVAIADQNSLRQAIVKNEPGDKVTLELVRRGKRLEEEITLGEAPANRGIPPMALIPDRAAEMNRLMNKPLGLRFGPIGGEDLHRELMEQVERALGDHGQRMPQLRLQFDNNARDGVTGFQRSVRLEEKDGSVEMKTQNDQRTVIVRDRDGKVLFEGPYNTEEEKAAVPEEFQDRVERLDTSSGKSSFKFKFGSPVPGEEAPGSPEEGE